MAGQPSGFNSMRAVAGEAEGATAALARFGKPALWIGVIAVLLAGSYFLARAMNVPLFDSLLFEDEDERTVPGSQILPQTDPADPNAPAPTPEPLPAVEPIPAEIVAPARLVIPSIELDAPVIPVGYRLLEQNGQNAVQWAVPNERAAGWHSLTAGLGQAGNTVLNGHNNAYGEVFRYLIDVNLGDLVIAYSSEREYLYRVTEKHILPERDQPLEVRLANAQWILPTDDERLTLVTCWPYTSNTHRLIVVAQPVEFAEPGEGNTP